MIFKRLFCRHQYEWEQNLFGDHIGGKRSVWKCKYCSKIQYRDELYYPGMFLKQYRKQLEKDLKWLDQQSWGKNIDRYQFCKRIIERKMWLWTEDQLG